MSSSLACEYNGCHRRFRNRSGLTQHQNSTHRDITPLSESDDDTAYSYTYIRHPHLTADPCDVDGFELPPFTPPHNPPDKPVDGRDPSADAWDPFDDRLAFDFAKYHFVELQDSRRDIAQALDMWAATVIKHGGEPEDVPWRTAKEMYKTIDAIQLGDVPWKVYKVQYQGPLPDNPPKWMTQMYELCTRDSRLLLHQQLACRDFKSQFDYVPYQQRDRDDERVWSNLMSADWAWKQADIISEDPDTHGCMLVPIISGSDKTTVSVATGHQEYHPVYQSPGNIFNTARRGHGIGVMPSSFLPIPKTSQRHRRTVVFKRFCRQLYHACLSKIYEPLKPGMTIPEVVLCPDGHFRRAIYSLGPYIADYPEQVWLAAIVQGWCPK
ncbi:hypothetical protein HGRIS_014901 [Hohenbuehelia grisea]